MRHAAEDMDARNECMEIMRELFRQFMSQLILEKVKLEQNCIYLDPRITFNEIDRYFFNGAAGAYFQIAVDCYTDLRLNEDDWVEDEEAKGKQPEFMYDIWLLDYDHNQKVSTIKVVRDLYGAVYKGLAETKNAVESAPILVASGLTQYQLYVSLASLDTVNAKYNFCEHGQKPSGT